MSVVLHLISGVLIVFIAIEIVSLLKSLKAKKWKTVTGKLVDWDMHFCNGGESSNLIINKLKYSYSVSGNDHLSNRVAFGFPSIMNADSVGRQVEKVLKDAPEVKVYYNPNKPEQSTLMVGIKQFHIYKLFAFFLVLSLAIAGSNAL